MNKGALVSWQGHDFIGGRPSGFTRKKTYKVIAGQGDGVPRSDGKLGAFIQNDTQFVVEDDRGNCIVCSITSSDWKLVRDAKSNYKPKPEAASPIVHGRSVGLNPAIAAAYLEQGEVSQGDLYGHG